MKEFELLSEIYRHNDALGARRAGEAATWGSPEAAAMVLRPRRVPIPPGDDMGMVEWLPQVRMGGPALDPVDSAAGAPTPLPALTMGPAGSIPGVLIAVDQIVGGSHVNLERDPIELIGRKAMTRNLSDIAAMAAIPVASVAACVLPRDFGRDRAEALFHAMRAVAAHYACPLIGGDISMADGTPLFISVTVLAEPGPFGVKRRGDAQAGDDVYVSGRLGGAWRTPSPPSSAAPSAGDRASALEALAARAVAGAEAFPEHPWHLTFEPRMSLALELARRVEVRAMIDLSDGLGRDLDHIAEMSGLRAQIDAERLPIRPGCDWRQAIGDGEDYELCFTVPGGTPVPDALLDVPLTRVGVMLPKEPAADDDPASQAWRTMVAQGGRKYDASRFGWEHRGSEEG